MINALVRLGQMRKDRLVVSDLPIREYGQGDEQWRGRVRLRASCPRLQFLHVLLVAATADITRVGP